MALASPSPSDHINIPKASDGGKHGYGANNHANLPLTPPNSISPNLPAHVTRDTLSSPPPVHLDQDIDLQDAVEHAATRDQPQLVALSKDALSGLDSVGSITASMLAKQYLPSIMIGQGSMAIRNITACLTQSVPGFSRIPPAKARRLIVSALENGNNSDRSVQFEKLGWGRWGARPKGQAKGPGMDMYLGTNYSPPASGGSSFGASYTEGLQIPSKGRHVGRRENMAQSWASSAHEPFDDAMEDLCMAAHEADKMSLDGSVIGEDPSDDSDSLSDADDDTEEEDWTHLDPEALRKASVSTAATASGPRRNYNLLCMQQPVSSRRYSTSRRSSYALSRRDSYATSRRASSAFLGKSAPGTSRYAPPRTPQQFSAPLFKAPDYGGGRGMDLDTPQEREAVEALLRMGSM